MFTAQRPLFIYTISPLHMGSGSAIGLVDNPIQREVHTHWPSMAGSGIKGAIRSALKNQPDPQWSNDKLIDIFGPEPGQRESSQLHAGAVSFTDAQIVCFPVRSLKQAYVYTTCPTALARLRRLINNTLWEDMISISEQEALIINNSLTQNDIIILEDLAFKAITNSPGVNNIAQYLAEKAMPKGFFAEKFKKDLVILSDTDFTYFVKNSTLIEPHVRINDETGTAESGGLFYTENLPPESLLVTLVMASNVRKKDGVDANEVMEKLSDTFSKNRIWQFGGDATTGRGLVLLRMLPSGGEKK